MVSHPGDGRRLCGPVSGSLLTGIRRGSPGFRLPSLSPVSGYTQHRGSNKGVTEARALLSPDPTLSRRLDFGQRWRQSPSKLG